MENDIETVNCGTTGKVAKLGVPLPPLKGMISPKDAD